MTDAPERITLAQLVRNIHDIGNNDAAVKHLQWALTQDLEGYDELRKRQDNTIIEAATDIAEEDYNEHPDTKRLRASEAKLEAVRKWLDDRTWSMSAYAKEELKAILNGEASDDD